MGERILLPAVLAVVLLWLLLPIVMPISISFSESEVISFPPTGFTLRWLRNIFQYPSFINGLKVSTIIALSASMAAILINLPTCYALVRHRIPGKEIVENLFTLPTVAPQIVLGYALMVFAVKVLGLSSLMGLLIGHIVIVFPFSMRIIHASLVNLSPEIEEAAVSLGASRIKAFTDVILPNLREGIIGAFIMSFMVSFNAISISLFLGTGGAMPLPVVMFNYLVIRFDPTLAAISLLMVVFTLVLSMLVEKTVGLAIAGGGVR